MVELTETLIIGRRGWQAAGGKRN